jgi:hypothetical protein
MVTSFQWRNISSAPFAESACLPCAWAAAVDATAAMAAATAQQTGCQQQHQDAESSKTPMGM